MARAVRDPIDCMLVGANRFDPVAQLIVLMIPNIAARLLEHLIRMALTRQIAHRIEVPQERRILRPPFLPVSRFCDLLSSKDWFSGGRIGQ